MTENEKPTVEKVVDRLSGSGIVKTTRICIDLQVTEFSEPVDEKEARIDLNWVDQEVIDDVHVFENSRGKVEILPGGVLSEKTSKKIVEELL